jgi:hypothetical protein
MHINTPDPWVRDGEFSVRANPGGPGGHFAIVEMGDEPGAWKVGLTLHDVSDCERIIRAAATAKRMLETISAGTPHEFTPGAGYGGHCVTCGLLRDTQAHVTPEQPDADGQGAPRGAHPRPASPATAAPAATAA